MSKRTNRVQVALGGQSQPVGEIILEADGRRQANVFRYAVEWLDNPERFSIAPSMPVGESPFLVSGSRTNLRNASPGSISDSASDSWGRGLIHSLLVIEDWVLPLSIPSFHMRVPVHMLGFSLIRRLALAEFPSLLSSGACANPTSENRRLELLSS